MFTLSEVKIRLTCKENTSLESYDLKCLQDLAADIEFRNVYLTFGFEDAGFAFFKFRRLAFSEVIGCGRSQRTIRRKQALR